MADMSCAMQRIIALRMHDFFFGSVIDALSDD